MKHLTEFEEWAETLGKPFLSYPDVGFMKDAFDEGWRQGKNNSKALDFVIQYLYSEHNICAPDDDAAPYSPEELKEMAIEILKKR